jgi:hypothetical protein
MSLEQQSALPLAREQKAMSVCPKKKMVAKLVPRQRLVGRKTYGKAVSPARSSIPEP